MGQYYKIMNIDKKEQISYSAAKLAEWSYMYAERIQTLMGLMLNEWKGDRIFVVGDYAISNNLEGNIKEVTLNIEKDFRIFEKFDQDGYRRTIYGIDYKEVNVIKTLNNAIKKGFFINHKEKIYVDLSHCPTEWYFENKGKYYRNCFSPISLLLALGNGLGGGDYSGRNEGLVGLWVKDMYENGRNIEFSLEKPNDYEEFVPDFTERKTIIKWNDDVSNIKLLEECKESIARFNEEEKRRKETITINFKDNYIYCNGKSYILNDMKIFKEEKIISVPIRDFKSLQLIIENKGGLKVKRKLSTRDNLYIMKKERGYYSNYYDLYISDKLANLKFKTSQINFQGNLITVRNIYSLNINGNVVTYETIIFNKYLDNSDDYLCAINELKYVKNIEEYDKYEKEARKFIKIKTKMLNKLDNFIQNFNTDKEWSSKEILKEMEKLGI